jgi:small-conductance mechanosensitive channel
MQKFLSQIPVAEGWQHLIGMGIIIVATIIVAAVVRLVLWKVIGHFAKKTKSDLDDRLLAATRRHVYLLIYVFGATVLFNFIQSLYVETVGEKTFEVIDGITYSLGVLIVAGLIIRIISTSLLWYGETIAAKTESTVDDEIVPLLNRVARIVVFSLAALIVLDHFKIDVKGLIAVLGVGSLAIALAAQDTVANMIAGFVIMVDRPFRVGDRLRLTDGTIVIVHQVGIRSTRLLTLQNSMIISPNSELTKREIHNLSYPSEDIQVRVSVGVAYGTDIAKVRAIVLDEATRHPKVLKNPPPSFSFDQFGSSSLDISLFCRVAHTSDQFVVGSEMRERLLNRFRAERIQIPFPHLVITKDEPGSDSK